MASTPGQQWWTRGDIAGTHSMHCGLSPTLKKKMTQCARTHLLSYYPQSVTSDETK